jgi:hypothetical protein
MPNPPKKTGTTKKPASSTTKTYTTTKPKPTTGTTSNKTYKPNKPLPEVKVTPKKITPAPKPVVSEDKYRYFGGERGKPTPTKELTKAEYTKYYNSKDPNMGLTKILKSDTAKINNLQRSYGASTIKGFTPLKTKTTPKKP